MINAAAEARGVAPGGARSCSAQGRAHERLAAGEYFMERAGGDRRREEKSLAVYGVHRPELAGLSRRLDSLCDDSEIEVLAEVDDTAHQLRLTGSRSIPLMNERSILRMSTG